MFSARIQGLDGFIVMWSYVRLFTSPSIDTGKIIQYNLINFDCVVISNLVI